MRARAEKPRATLTPEAEAVVTELMLEVDDDALLVLVVAEFVTPEGYV
jgi:hypothetical protein